MILKHSLILASFIFSGVLYSQANITLTLPVVTLMDIEPTGNITLKFTAPTEAGNPLANPTPDTSKWINYTSAITSGGLTRRITAAISGTTLIPGVNIRLQAAAASGAGGGTLGTPSAQVTLTNTPITIISGIGGAYTGNGVNNGHRLTISLVPSTYANLSAQTNTVLTIVYTITE
ncbi:hypothetical protein EG344_13355 [Chryseobacterium sp. G0162]|uniref:Uncharacterized protein n=1 Tax=Chryseobacterium nakagawai TaxID=1241982 RepID=A0AAD0YK82_CHRNA|nr:MULTISPECIES: hypothetical protein [Chryseobacterium]AZA91342.1 hypothetical protein EG343_12195 [Chryseobacterium nakagawai]AZB09727.1 hypothetical protein EG344_13355 [Chryseobacterium sp. G0162]VEH22921.1 Uncharacterised protein [Chryseobacterium nakagawai]